MGKAGRKAKTGKRERNGRIKRNNYAGPQLVKGNDRVQDKIERYGTHHGSALGRAYAAGLLGDGNEAKARYDTGARFGRLYSALIVQREYRCPLDRESSSAGFSGQITDHPKAMEDEAWLFAMINKLDGTGLRPWMDGLTLDTYCDQGPYWLDNILAVHRWNAELPSINAGLREEARLAGRPFVQHAPMGIDRRDQMILDTAIKALDLITPKPRVMGILAQVY